MHSINLVHLRHEVSRLLIGNHELNIHHDVYTQRLNKNGHPIVDKKDREVVGQDNQAAIIDLKETKPCGNCYGAMSDSQPCCNTCDEVKNAYHAKGWIFNNANGIEQCVKEDYLKKIADQQQQHEGCNVHGHIETQRGIGNFNVVVGNFIIQNSKYLFDAGEFKNFQNADGHFSLNSTHYIHHLSFGQEFPGQVNPLDGKHKIQTVSGVDTSFMYEYYVKVVPTKFQIQRSSQWISSNQYSVTEFSQKVNLKEINAFGAPGAVFLYELSPITVDYVVKRMSFFHFLANLLAILGGIFTVSSLLDKFVFSLRRLTRGNEELVK